MGNSIPHARAAEAQLSRIAPTSAFDCSRTISFTRFKIVVLTSCLHHLSNQIFKTLQVENEIYIPWLSWIECRSSITSSAKPWEVKVSLESFQMTGEFVVLDLVSENTVI